MLLAALALVVAQDDPAAFGRAELERAAARAGVANVWLGERPMLSHPLEQPEAYFVALLPEGVSVYAEEPVGEMYACLHAAELIARRGAAALDGTIVPGWPYLAVRALNPFLTLPWNEATNEPDYDPAALTDPQRWWFHDDDYWRTLFDEMARCRLNTLDLHGAYDIHTTRFPNLYAYFVDSRAFPEVGVATEIKARNLAQLNRVIELAHARGVKVSVMSYEARFDTPHRAKVPYESSEANLATYTREVVEALIRGAPGLDALGFRIGESGHSAGFFQCYLDAVSASGRDIPLYTRSWITRKAQVVPLARASSDFTVEIKFNGEQWGPPYPVAGGRVPGWYSYSFEDYLSSSGDAPAKKLWPGNFTAAGREPWPSQPYKIVWQVRANGTHRIFPFYEPSLVRRTVTSMKLGTATGFSVEPLNAYYPPSPRYYTADPKQVAFDWIHERDEPFLMLWGRLGYDPSTPDEVLDALAAEHIGGDRELLETWKAASRVIPTAFTAFSLGPDHRNHAPELEWGGDTNTFITTAPFDSHVFRSVQETQAYAALSISDGRLDVTEAGKTLWSSSNRLAESGDSSPHGPATEIAAACDMLAHLSSYYSRRFDAAREQAASETLADPSSRVSSSGVHLLSIAVDDWRALCESKAAAFYKPFPERLRLGTDAFTWKSQLPALIAEHQRLSARQAQGSYSHDAGTEFGKPLDRLAPQIRWTVREDRLRVSVTAPERTERAWLLAKPLPSSTYFHRTPMQRAGDAFVSESPLRDSGSLIAVDLGERDSVARIPDWREQTPYLVVPSRAGPTPMYYSSEEALAYLDPQSLDPAKHGVLLVCPRAGDFFWRFGRRDQRKLLDAVERGMTLLILQQDFASGRFKLDWLPQPPMIESAPASAFDSAGALGLEQVGTADILWQPIRASDGWEVFGNGGVAQQQLGKGRIVLVQARLMQRMHVPAAARNLKTLLELGGRDKPLVIVDAGSENATFATSVFPDLCNALGIPFLTLGEVIAEEQGLVTERVAGRAWPDDVLEGRGPKIVRDFLRAKVREKANRPVPATRAELETRQQEDQLELLRSLGLAPLPPRTPLNARTTGVLKRDGYKIEKLVYESRPGVVVTANLYEPDPLPAQKLPVIVDAHGHWQHKKSEPVVQKRAIAQALHGYAALVVDSPGHSFEGDTPVERRELGTHDDLRLTAAGVTATSVYAWDLMRGLDYLETRPECDATRAGITGESGGGTATLYTFAADERFDVAVPVVYATSLAVQPDNGCLCNHVPGTLQIGDRADVLAIRAPAPVLVIGARDDVEFPPEGTRATGEKLGELWQLFDAGERVAWKVFDGPHDYSQPMRELAVGFFDRYLRNQGDGSPVPEPAIHPEPADTRSLDCAGDSLRSSVTMREIARDALRRTDTRPATWDEVVAINGGMPLAAALDVRVLATGDDRERPSIVTFRSEPGLTLPGLLYGSGSAGVDLVLVSEGGKLAAVDEFDVPRLVENGLRCLCIDARGCGELGGLDARLMTYLGTSQAFAMGWDAARAAQVLLQLGSPRRAVVVVGRGACASQAACYAARFEPRVRSAIGIEGIESLSLALDDGIPLTALQPRTIYGSLRVPHPAELPGVDCRNHARGERVDLLGLRDALGR